MVNAIFAGRIVRRCANRCPSDLWERRQSLFRRGSPPMTADDIKQESTLIDLEDETGGRLTDIEKRAVILDLRPQE